jgi:predicted tellurium resistance membrane protein TerC
VTEIHHTIARAHLDVSARRYSGFIAIVVQIALLDIVFSLDSVFTAVGLANQLSIMVTAIIISMLVMIWLSAGVSAFIERYPTLKILAMAFLILAMAFSVGVELTNIRLRKHLDARRRARGR